MSNKEKPKRYEKNIVTETILKSEAKPLEDNPAGETVCSPYFSQGCINEDTDLSMLIEGENEYEKH